MNEEMRGFLTQILSTTLIEEEALTDTVDSGKQNQSSTENDRNLTKDEKSRDGSKCEIKKMIYEYIEHSF